ncbi:MAG: hypothetical protein LC792_23000, partial [Actinobacteria bacterium]|nr:hypothetical protein [Actinomycetota bacterium]
HELRKHLEDTMGEERAMTLMDHLPPVGWADVATKEYVDWSIERLRTEMNARFDVVNTRLDGLVTQAQFHRDLRTQTMALMGMNLTFFGLVVTVLKLP